MSCSEILLQSDIAAGRVDCKASDALVKEVYKIMKNDEISGIAKSDPLIVQAGNGGLGVGVVVPSDCEELAALALAVKKTLSLKKGGKRTQGLMLIQVARMKRSISA